MKGNPAEAGAALIRPSDQVRGPPSPDKREKEGGPASAPAAPRCRYRRARQRCRPGEIAVARKAMGFPQTFAEYLDHWKTYPPCT